MIFTVLNVTFLIGNIWLFAWLIKMTNDLQIGEKQKEEIESRKNLIEKLKGKGNWK